MLRTFGTWTLLTAAIVIGLADAVGQLTVLSNLLVACAIFVGIPYVIAAAMTAVVSVLAIFVLVAGSVAWASSRPSGAGAVVTEAFGIAWAVVPGYYRALGRVRSAAVWGFVGGMFGAMLWLGTAAILGADANT